MPTSEQQPSTIGPYQVDRRLGHGGMGEVFLGFSAAGDPAAVKRIKRDQLNPGTRARFEREAKIAQTLTGTNRVARFLDADPYADSPWMSMQYVPGLTLRDFVGQHGALELPLVASVTALLAEGLDAVHRVKLLHRDLKPQNVMLGAEGPIIIDFGLGAFVEPAEDSLSTPGQLIGTVMCMAPEQAVGDLELTTATDVYGLGTVLLYAAAGRYPWGEASLIEVLGHLKNPDANPDVSAVPAPLRPLIASMLARNVWERPALADVVDVCAGLFKEFGVKPWEARQALIAHVKKSAAAVMREPEPPPWDQKAKNWLISDQPDTTDQGDMVLTDEPGSQDSQNESGSEGEKPAKSSVRRVLPSTRVAERLRSEYAARPGL
ncbi:serine/threonine-protein kinase [Kineosporia babensis]|uniref:Serine/threonine protein kinase n=1 Tax=Kineosporia babensis TaxID=499548 RepID=A0A9X1NQ44_9ACTN|nr:serine/threonine protein kinase [Kineosporia babensis]